MATEEKTASLPFQPRKTSSAEPLTAAPLEETPLLESAAPSLASVFDGAFDLYKRHAVTLILITALVFLPTQIVMHAIMDTWLKPILVHLDAADKPDMGESFLAICGILVLGVPQFGIPGIVSLFALLAASGPTTIAVADIVLGRPVSIRRAYRTARSQLARLMGTWLLIGMACLGLSFILILFAFVLVLLAAALMAGTAPDAFGIALLILMFALPYLVLCAMVARWFCLTTPLLVLERCRAAYVPARNTQLMGQAGFKRAFAACVFLPLVTFGLQFLTLISLNEAVQAFRLAPIFESLLGIAVSTVVTLFYQPYWMIFLTLFYFHYRVAREGLDMVVLAERLLPHVAPPVPPSQRPTVRPPAQAIPPFVPALPPRVRPAPVVPPLPPAPSPSSAEREEDAP